MGAKKNRKYPDARLGIDIVNLRNLLGEHELEKFNILYTGYSSFPAEFRVLKGSSGDTVEIAVSVKKKPIVSLSVRYKGVARKLANKIISLCDGIFEYTKDCVEDE